MRKACLGGWQEFVGGPKPTLSDGVFNYALAEFWKREGDSTALTAEQISYAAGSPGRVFKLAEDSVVSRLMVVAELTGGAWEWRDTAGLRRGHQLAAYDQGPLLQQSYAAPRRPA